MANIERGSIMNKNTIHPLVRKIASPVTGMIMLGFGLLAQAPHTQDVFWQLGHDKSSWFFWLVAWSCALTIDGAVMYYVANGNHLPSYIFTGVSVSMNLVYYHLHGNSLWQPEVWLVSGSLPATITFYSHLIASGSHDYQEAPSAKWFASFHFDFGAIKLPTWLQSKPEHVITLQQEPTQLEVQAPYQANDKLAQVEQASGDSIAIDDLDQRILACIIGGCATPYAISKQLGIALTTLQRKNKTGKHVGRLPSLVNAGYLRNDDNKYVVA